jgi:hypothetical protein
MALIEGDGWTQDFLCVVVHQARAVPGRGILRRFQPSVLKFEAVFNDLMNVWANFSDVLSLIFVAQLMHTQEQAVIIDVQSLKQICIVLDLLEQGFLDVKVNANLLLGIGKI